MSARALTMALVLAVAGAGGASTARAQDPRLVRSLGGDAAARVERLVDSARASGLPVQGLVGVALEGASRHVPADRILAAVGAYLSTLESARRALGPRANNAELAAGAGVLLSGLTPAELGKFSAARQGLVLTVPLVVLSDLIARGVPRDTASRAVYLAISAGVRDDQLSTLRERVESDIRAGAPPGAAMLTRLGTVPGMAALAGGGRLPPIVPSDQIRKP